MLVMTGQAERWIDGDVRSFGPREAVVIPPSIRHRLIAVTDVDVIEVSTPELGDVVRLEDLYGRTGTSTP